MSRLERELTTLRAMLALFCRRQHGQADLCPACQELWDYAEARVRRCPHLPAKPACNRCPVHCFKPQRRQQIRKVMRFSGPRMLLAHPWLALWHLWDSRRRVSEPGLKGDPGSP